MQMDAGVYPDAAVRDAAKNFVCIRVEHDKRPDLVKRYGVKPLPDLRLIDADGRERTKLVGFTSAAKFVAECRAFLDGKAAGGSSPVVVRPVNATAQAVKESVAKGSAFLKAASRKALGGAAGFEPDELVLFALASAGCDSKDEDVDRLLKAVAKAPITSTYRAALRALALSRIDAKAHRDAIAECATWLVAAQLANGQWTYRAPKAAEAPALGDNSNTAYALLGLAACAGAGIDVPSAAVEKAEAWWTKSQQGDGGWGYRTDRESESYASMTESGVGSLLLCAKLRGRRPDAGILKRGLAWIAGHFSIRENTLSAYQQGRLIYHLYAMERVGSLAEGGKIGEHDWFKESAEYLLGTQRDDGSWDDGAETPVPNTALALLVLTRSSRGLK